MGETEDFNTLAFEKRLMQLKDTQESIQSLSSWCLKQRTHHKKIVSSWLNVLKRVKIEQRLVLFYLANDVVQYSKRKGYDFVESWGLYLQKATPLVRDEKVRPKILRIFKIWEQRSVYDDEFLSDLTGLLSAGAIKKSDDDALDFQPQQLVNKIKQCTVLEADTDMRLKSIHENQLPLSDIDALSANLKERCLKDNVDKEVTEGIACVERYTQALQREIVARETLLALLTSATQYYSTQRGEVKVVAYAYKNFGARVRALKRKLDELIPNLPSSAPSPPPRDEDVPSPGPDEDLDLPVPDVSEEASDDLAYNIDQSFNTTLGPDGSLYNLGLTSFLTSDNPMAIFNESNEDYNSTNKIEVINSRPTDKPDFNINDFLKNLIPNDNTVTSDNNSVGSGTLSQKSQDALPGLDLLTPESNGNPPPPTSFYGTINDEPEASYIPEVTSPWEGNSWNVAAITSIPPPPVIIDTPESPPHHQARGIPFAPVIATEAPPVSDVDHRGILPPPPPPPVLSMLGHIEDVDHRLLPTLSNPPPPVAPPATRHPILHQDVDHRNLISLTHQLAAPLPNSAHVGDQDYRVPVMVQPTDIVESVDMDLSEDEDPQTMYGSQQQNQAEHSRRHIFNNNKVLVGGEGGAIRGDLPLGPPRPPPEPERLAVRPVSAPLPPNPALNPPAIAPMTAPANRMVNPFDAMPPSLKKFAESRTRMETEGNYEEYGANERNYRSEEDFEEYANEGEWCGPPSRFMSPRFPRAWRPRAGFRGSGFGPWPRPGPRPNRWMGPRPQRFW
ncbi:regulation of nuclear pre-mRNA domain-containing protein 2 isoform X1 [Bombyx mandarina]|uniref:Regulation of nuclear pre-mRNA domain-containing protein 2 n=1 Tax=Bombyx mandarina TaxID=7092 RepID=A0A6J2KLF9_BOMMA|nr:regulation of nuclear pre-mRNA domain-containing protein 2 isoform X1 [Bombyx mandarina]